MQANGTNNFSVDGRRPRQTLFRACQNSHRKRDAVQCLIAQQYSKLFECNECVGRRRRWRCAVAKPRVRSCGCRSGQCRKSVHRPRTSGRSSGPESNLRRGRSNAAQWPLSHQVRRSAAPGICVGGTISSAPCSWHPFLERLNDNICTSCQEVEAAVACVETCCRYKL